jgi:hypothetical protein
MNVASKVIGNTAGGNGGGVWMGGGDGRSGSLFTMNDTSSVSGNTAGDKGAGAYAENTAVIEMSGAAQIANNNPVYLTSPSSFWSDSDSDWVYFDHFITVTGAMTGSGGAVLDSEVTTPGTVLVKGTTSYSLADNDVAKFDPVPPLALGFEGGSNEITIIE